MIALASPRPYARALIPVEGALVAERFRLVRALGQGGMGEVWLAHDQRLDTPCAVKFLRGTAVSGAARARFEREAKAAAQLRSPNVVQILDHGDYMGDPYIAMEMLQGEDLATRLARLGRIEPKPMAEIVSQVSKALTKAHAAGLVHRDLKPANIFLVPDGDTELVKVLDFGVVKDVAAPASTRAPSAHEDASVTRTGQLIGTPAYMSPEQARGERELDGRSDLWSLGVLTYQCTTGRLPFIAPDVYDMLTMILLDGFPKASEVSPGLDPSIDAWFDRALAREPSRRFQSPRELSDAWAELVIAPRVAPAAAAPPDATPPIPTIALGPATWSALEAAPLHAPGMRRRAWPYVVLGLGAAVVSAAAVLLVLGRSSTPRTHASNRMATSSGQSATPTARASFVPGSLATPFPKSSHPPLPSRPIPAYEEAVMVQRILELGWTLFQPARTDKGSTVITANKEGCSGSVQLMRMENAAAARSYVAAVVKNTFNEHPVYADDNRVMLITIYGADQPTAHACVMELYDGLTPP